MRSKCKPGSGLYLYLESTGVLNSENEKDIIDAKKKYWSLYRKTWKKNKRQQSKVYIVMFTFKEARMIDKKARNLGLTPVKLLKHLAVSENNTAGPVVTGQIREKLILYSSDLETKIENTGITEIEKEALLSSALELEKSILAILKSE